MLRKSLKFLFFLFLVFGFLSAGQLVLSDECRQGETQDCGICGVQTCECNDEIVETPTGPITVTVCDWGDCNETPKPSESSSSSWTEYKCQGTSCGNDVLYRNCTENCTRTCDCVAGGWQCTSWSCDTSCGSENIYQDCQSWQACKNGISWSTTRPQCQCAGTCLATPINPRYYDDPTYSDQSDKNKGSTNIYLPVKLDWDDVIGWGEENGPQSYIINIPKKNLEETLDKSEFIPPESCFYKSNENYDWQVKACCDRDSNNCGPESSWDFTTNAAPEPISPYDPDWNGPEKAENVSLPAALTWCRVEKIDDKNVYSYNLLPYIVENEAIKCHPSRQSDGTCIPITLSYSETKKTDSIEYIEYSDELAGLFTKLNSYAWQVSACKTGLGGECGGYSQIWAFNTGETTLEEVSWFSPPDGSTVGLPVILEWKPPWGANSFQYEVYKGASKITSGITTALSVKLEKLDLNTDYKWRIRVCWDYEAKDCEDWPSTWEKFKTIGVPPELLSPANNATEIEIPTKLIWQGILKDVLGDVYYKYELADNPNFNNVAATGILKKDQAEVLIDYPQLKMFKDYWWRVKVCVDERGINCGNWSKIRKLTTFKLSAPTNPSPRDGGELFTDEQYISWNPVSPAKAYQYTIKFLSMAPEEKSEECTSLINQEIVKDKIVSSNSDFVSLNCLGNYQWHVKACLDSDCQETGDPAKWQFTLSELKGIEKIGLVPCGRKVDNPNTPWNEREPCQIKHIFLLLRNILDFLFWRIGLIILVLLVVATGIIYYFSVASPEILGGWAAVPNIRAIWRSAGIGYGIIFLAWLIINLFLAIIGYKFQIFGHWWQIKF